MNISPVVIAIPVYFILIGIELLAHRFSKHQSYRLNDALANINCGITSQVMGAFLKVFSIGVYTLLFSYLKIFEIPQNIWTGIIAFVVYDFCYYWAHRMSHEVNLFWGGHVVHHQSEEYNLSVALRQSSTQVIWTFMFILPMAIIGFHPITIIAVSGLNLLYQFWIHTESIGKMGILEKFMNTPSHHRVHHARNPKYIDKNHGGTFIIFDRLFGTFKEEEERPVYGITKPLNSWNPVWANFSHYVDIFSDLKRVRSFGDGVKLLFNKPGWRPQYLGGYQAPGDVDPKQYRKFDTQTALSENIYALVNYLILLAGSAFFLFNEEAFPLHEKLGIAALIVWTTLNIGALFEHKSWFKVSEIVRILALLATLIYFL
jgi:alkylglycerol monooxygenase